MCVTFVCPTSNLDVRNLLICMCLPSVGNLSAATVSSLACKSVTQTHKHSVQLEQLGGLHLANLCFFVGKGGRQWSEWSLIRFIVA